MVTTVMLNWVSTSHERGLCLNSWLAACALGASLGVVFRLQCGVA